MSSRARARVRACACACARVRACARACACVCECARVCVCARVSVCSVLGYAVNRPVSDHFRTALRRFDPPRTPTATRNRGLVTQIGTPEWARSLPPNPPPYLYHPNSPSGCCVHAYCSNLLRMYPSFLSLTLSNLYPSFLSLYTPPSSSPLSFSLTLDALLCWTEVGWLWDRW